MENTNVKRRRLWSPFRRFQTDRYTWHDNIIIISLLFLALLNVFFGVLSMVLY